MFGTLLSAAFPYFALAALGLATYYVLLMERYHHHWQSLPAWEIPPNYQAQTFISIIIPARNEAANIEECLQSVLSQNFPADRYEILLIDDHSTDQTPELVEALAQQHPQLRLLRLRDLQLDAQELAFKKKAIEWGISQAKGELLLTTDADCRVPPDWLRLMASYYEDQAPVFIAAPVNFDREQSAFERFQSLDFIGMMGITGAGIHGAFQHMCNGANLAYTKTAFHAVNGFQGIDQKASGDDMLLLQKLAHRFPGQIAFLKNPAATVRTPAMPTIRQFLNQRLRWASKSRDYPEWQVTLRLALVFFFCWSIILNAVFAFYWGWPGWCLLVLLLILKNVADYRFLRTMSQYFQRRDLLPSFASSAWYHLWYIAVVGLLANVKRRYEWKGREVR